MMRRRRHHQRGGSSLIEFVLVGIPTICMLISTIELARGMWTYFTMAYATKEGARYAVVHGKGCSLNGNTCTATVATVARQIASAGIGLDAGTVNATFYSANGSVPCNPLNSCYANNTTWPPTADGAAGSDIQISSSYAFKSALCFLWPGAGSVPFSPIYFSAYSRQEMQF